MLVRAIPQAVPALDCAFDRSDVHDTATWLQKCRDDLAQLWNDGDLWALTEVVETKAGRAIHIVAMAGTYRQSLVDEIEAWGRSVGCRRSYFTGRKGWLRKVPDYRLKTVTLEKEI